jgi:hypothetical protein
VYDCLSDVFVVCERFEGSGKGTLINQWVLLSKKDACSFFGTFLPKKGKHARLKLFVNNVLQCVSDVKPKQTEIFPSTPRKVKFLWTS